MSVETDRELLELAAKAAGYTTEHKWNAERLQLDPPVIALVVHENGELVSTGWNPLDTDGHALRLAVKLRIVLDFRGSGKEVPAHIYANFPKKHRWWADDGKYWVGVEYVPEEMWGGSQEDKRFADWYIKEHLGVARGVEAATRRAIVLAAAAIGRAMP